MISGQPDVSVLCVGRHSYLSDHFARYFGDLGFSTRAVVGLECAVFAARESLPDVVLCDYELLATLSLECWEQDELLSRTAVIAVSLARRPNETDLLDINGIAGFLYLPTLDRLSARQTLLAAAAASRARYTLAPPTTSLSAASMCGHAET